MNEYLVSSTHYHMIVGMSFCVMVVHRCVKYNFQYLAELCFMFYSRSLCAKTASRKESKERKLCNLCRPICDLSQ